MGELAIIDNPDLEIAGVVDIETFVTLAIVGVGPNRETILRAFIDAMPFDPTVMDAATQREAFIQFLERSPGLMASTPPPLAEDAVGADNGNGNDAEAARSESEAHNHTDTPSAGPADTDAEADQGAPTVTVRCWMCEGRGLLESVDGNPPAPCGLCGGSGKVEQVAA